jgi:large subunit ribosomal protein L21
MATAKSTLSKAIIVTGGKQYIVSIGKEIAVEKLEVEVGSTITFDKVVMAADDQNNLADATKASVEAEVLEQGKGKKIRVSTFKSKKRQRRTLGHRQLFTKVKVTGISVA